MSIKRQFTGALLCASALLAAAWSSAEAVSPETLTLEEIVTLKRVKSVRMNPNGEAIAYLLSVPRTLYVDDDGEAWVQLHVVDLQGESRPYFSGQVEVTALAWSADGNTLYFAANRQDGETGSDLHAMPLAGGAPSVIHTARSEIKALHYAPTGGKLAFLARDPKPEAEEDLADKGFKALVYEESKRDNRIWMMDLESGAVAAQDLPGSASDFAWAPGGEFYAVALAPTPLVDDGYMARDVFVVDAQDASVRNRLGSVGKLGAFAWSPDGERIAYTAGEDLHDPSPGRLYMTSARGGGERTELLPEFDGQVEGFYWTGDDSIAYFSSNGVWTGYDSILLEKIKPAATPSRTGPILRAVDSAPGQRLVAAVADAPAHPPEVYLLGEGAMPRRLTDSNPILEHRLLGRQEALTYRARDGLELDAILVHPLTPQPDGISPLIVFVHGGPEGHHSNGWKSTYSQPAHFLAARGYAVVYPNYRGSTGRGVAFSKLGQHAYAAGEFNDLVDVKAHLVEAGIADPGKVGISGGSYGGYASMWAASALSEHFAAAVAFVGISNQLSKFGTSDIPREMFNVHSRAWPWADWMWMLERSPVYHAGETRTPLLIMAGDKDPRVHPSQSLEMYRHVKLRTDTPVRLVFYPGEEHGNRHTAAQYDYALRFERWMRHYLEGPGGAPPPYRIDHAARLAERE